MSYGNNNYNRNNGYNRNSNYRNGNAYGNRNSGNRQAPKRSGAKYSIIRQGKFEGQTIINAWNKSRGKGLITAKVAPYGDSKEYTAPSSGKTYITMIAEITYHNSGHTRIIPCSMNKATKSVVLSDIGMVITQNGSGLTSSGKKVSGYFGKFSR
jgi:hypothetical protein|nr:hypothetical protein [Allomuricauda sp.]